MTTDRNETQRPVVEPSPRPDPVETGRFALELRIRQQQFLAELGVEALRPSTLPELLDRAVMLAAKGLDADFCKVLKYIPADKRLRLTAGVGWESELIGTATVGADLESPAGFALHTGKPVISNHLENEERFRTPELLRRHGVRRAINVILQGDGAPYGVLEVDSRSEGEFTAHDIAFLQGAANIVGMAIERQRQEDNLRQALERQSALVSEINHRVKNSLQLVASLLDLQAAALTDEAIAGLFREAVARVAAIARVHERLYRSPELGTVDCRIYLAEVCADLGSILPAAEIGFECDSTMPVATDRAVRVALLATELVTNAVRHQAGRGRVHVWVRLEQHGSSALRLSVRNSGGGLGEAGEGGGDASLNDTIIRALVLQTGGQLTIRHRVPGIEHTIEMPLKAAGPDAA